MSRRQPRPHQLAFMRWAKSRSSVPAFLQMRMGKCLGAIRWAESRPGDSNRWLISAPLSVCPTWRRELELEGHPVVELLGSQEERERAIMDAGGAPGFYLINHEGLTTREGGGTVASAYAMAPWDGVILDESTAIRNPRSRLCKVALRHLATAKYRAVLSGLPNPESAEDYVPQLLFTHGEVMGCRNFWEWRARHMQPSGFGWTIKAKSLGLLHQEVHERSFIMTRKQAGMYDEKDREVRYVRAPAAVMKAIASARRDFQVGDRLTDNALTSLTWRCQLASGVWPHDERLRHSAKMPALREVIDEAGVPILVWARFNDELPPVVRLAEQLKLRAAMVTGDVPPRVRSGIVEEFQAGRVDLLAIQSRCLSRGVDLSRARASVVLSNYFDFEIRSQLEDRLIHMNRREPARIIDVVCEGTPDEDIVEALTDKGASAASFNARLRRIAGRKGA